MSNKAFYGPLRKIGLPIVVGYQNRMKTTASYLHFHNTYEMLFIVSGKYKMLAPKNIYDGEGPCVAIFSKGIYHGVIRQECENVPFVCYDIYFVDEIKNGEHGSFFNVSPLLGEDVLVIKIDEADMRDFVAPRLAEFRKIYAENKPAGRTSPLMYSYLALLVNFLSEKTDTNTVQKITAKGDSYIIDVLKTITESNETGRDISVGDIAESFHVSASKLSKDFKNTTGVSIKPLMSNLKLERAKKLLEKDISIREISAMCGFSSDSYFNQFFNKQMGMSPGQYRSRI